MNRTENVSITRKRVLVVDDHPYYREATEIFLEASQGYEVVGAAGNGDEALDRASALQPDVVLIDLSMPIRSGLQTIPDLRRMLPGTAIVVLSISDESSYRHAALSAGADAYVAKPEAAEELLPVLSYVTQQPRAVGWS